MVLSDNVKTPFYYICIGILNQNDISVGFYIYFDILHEYKSSPLCKSNRKILKDRRRELVTELHNIKKTYYC